MLCDSQIDFSKQMEDHFLEIANPFNQPVAAIFRRCDSEDTSEIIQTFPSTPESGHPLIKQIDNVDDIFKSYDKSEQSASNKSILDVQDSRFFNKINEQKQQQQSQNLPPPLLQDSFNQKQQQLQHRQMSNSFYQNINSGNSFVMTSSFDHAIGSSFSVIHNNSITNTNMSFQFLPTNSFNIKENCLESIPSFRSVFNEEINNNNNTLIELLLLTNNSSSIYIHINSDGIISLPEIRYNNKSHLDCINSLLENEFNIPKLHQLQSYEIYHNTIQEDGKNIIFIKTIIPSSSLELNYYRNTFNYKWISWKEFVTCKNNNIITKLVNDKHLL